MAAFELRNQILRGFAHLVSIAVVVVLCLVLWRCSIESPEVLAEYWKIVLRLVRQIWAFLVYLSWLYCMSLIVSLELSLCRVFRLQHCCQY